ncbi:MAG TPA: hypothetical protein VN516_06595 [Candidatus Baltobacteraceae bacterium]|nr:hypothetical protein [Candidatus Baltobacteraceae bacterium]
MNQAYRRIFLTLLGVFISAMVLFAIANIWFGLWFEKFVLDCITGFFKNFSANAPF